MGASFVLLQEIPKWAHGIKISGWQLYGGVDRSSGELHSSCGIMVPIRFASLIHDVGFGKHWCGLVLKPGILLLSMHVLWKALDNTDEVLPAVDDFIDRCTRRFLASSCGGRPGLKHYPSS